MKRACCALVLALGTTGGASAQTGIAGVWSTTTVPFAPWVVTLAVSGSAVTGSVTQARYDAKSHFLAPFASMPIDSGRIVGAALSFQCILGAGHGNRIVSFVGKVYDDSIAFERKVTVLPGGIAGKSGAFGAEGPSHFAVTRGAPDTSATPADDDLAASFARQLIAAQTTDTAPTRSANANTIAYKGMTVDVTAIDSSPDRDAIVNALRRQIDIVDGVQLDAPTVAFLKSVSVRLHASAGVAGGNPGAYNGTTKTITLDAQPYPADHPILLHELMHAYHAAKLPDGVRNAEILALYHDAVTSGKWPADAYMLSNVNEYFAMMASVYLFGSAARDPFTRDSIRIKQPAMYQWLQNKFGPR